MYESHGDTQVFVDRQVNSHVVVSPQTILLPCEIVVIRYQ